MPTTPTARGDDGIHEQPDSPRVRRDARGVQVTQIFRGPFDNLKTYGPDVGDDFALSAFGLLPADTVVTVDEILCQPDNAGYGTLTIVYSNLPTGAGVLTGSQTTVEIDWTTLERPLEANPIYQPGGSKELNDTDLAKIQVWRNERTAANYAALSANAQHFVGKLKKGMESYVVGAPLVRKVTRGLSSPGIAAVGQRTATAPASGAPTGYVWLKTADRAIRQAPASGWERVEEWTGAKDWDAEIYTGVI